MKRLYALAMSCMAGIAAAQAPADDLLAGSTPIAGEALQARLAGKSYIWRAANAKFTAKVKYDANGYTFINISNGQNDSGTWKVDGPRVCTQWRNIPSSCSPEARTKGDLLLIQRADGTWATMTPD